MSKFYPSKEPGRRRRTSARRLRGALTYQTCSNGDTSQSEVLAAYHRHRSDNEGFCRASDPHHPLATMSCLSTSQGMDKQGALSNSYR
ncbi:hypothetical protein [uncultured Photobacterium sp.]|uniref:hypothetical protein n=1 Tax=uncultured Photobacterium sp. TaxID=173973 RepID=UPI00260ADD4A|nr:hypothetical protein [uncultured Photobacterium sp.]